LCLALRGLACRQLAAGLAGRPVDGDLLAVEVDVFHREPDTVGGVVGEFGADAAVGVGVVVRVPTTRR
jgi:hypothetical protein